MSNSVIDAFKGLNVTSARDVGNHEAIFDVSYQYLSKIKQFDDLGAFHNCIVSLINTDRYYKALQLIAEVPEHVHREFPLEKAYVYYKTGKTDLLNEVYQTTISSSNEVLLRAMKHVMAQSCYQNGDVAHALHLYHELIASNALDNEVDLACNERAILSQLMFQKPSAEKPTLDIADSYDGLFNNALIELAQGSYSASLDSLRSALSMCEDQNIDADPADLALETLPIRLTIAYIYHITGRKDDAVAALEALDLTDTSDLMLQVIFKNNLIAVQPADENANFSSRELNYHLNLHHLRHKLTALQWHSLLKNHLLLLYQTNTISKSSTYLTNRFFRLYSSSADGDITPLLYKVLVSLDITFNDLDDHLAAVSRKLYKYATTALQKNEVTDFVVAAVLLLVEVNSRAAKYDQSVLVLEQVVALELAGDMVHGSMLKLLIELYEMSNSKKLAPLYETVVGKFKAYTVDEIKASDKLYQLILSVAVKLLTSNLGDAITLLTKLAAVNPDDVVLSSILTSNTDALLPVEDLEADADIEDLLAVNVADLAPAVPAPVIKKMKAPEHKVTKKKTPKFSKHKFFKPASEFNAEKDLDKERWLPLKLRSYYKPSKKDLKKKSGGHQGAVEASPAPQAVPLTSSKSKKKKKKGKK